MDTENTTDLNPVFASGIGYIKTNPLMVIVIILSIIIIIMVYKMGEQSNYIGKPKKTKYT